MKTISVGHDDAERVIELLEFEFESLLQALRRDLRAERKYVNDTTEHGRNARMDVRLLEVLQPKANELPAGALIAATVAQLSATGATGATGMADAGVEDQLYGE